MALRGTLADIPIINLIQFPQTGRRTGRLVVTSDDMEATLFYKGGALVHAILGNGEKGVEALVRIVGLNAGMFEFTSEIQSQETSLEMDLHRSLMIALKLHDERKEQERSREAAPEPAPEPNPEPVPEPSVEVEAHAAPAAAEPEAAPEPAPAPKNQPKPVQEPRSGLCEKSDGCPVWRLCAESPEQFGRKWLDSYCNSERGAQCKRKQLILGGRNPEEIPVSLMPNGLYLEIIEISGSLVYRYSAKPPESE